MTNQEFLQGIFGSQAPRAHVTSFPDDPSHITNDRRPACWGGHRYGDRPLVHGNHYFTVSLFRDDDDGRPRRRKALFEACYVVVLDDVREKLDEATARRLPPPSYIMETSPGSEHWGFILDAPCTDRARLDNLMDGLIASDLAPSGKDPGMRGVTRYVRLPEGINTKKSKAPFGVYWQCKMHVWAPERVTSLEALALPLGIDLDVARRDARVDGAADLPDHPLLHVEQLLVKSELSPGRYEVQCPWVHEHTDSADDGAAVFTNADGSLGFKCHHGACEARTGRALLDWLETLAPGFRGRLATYQIGLSLPAPTPCFIDVPAPAPCPANAPVPDFLGARAPDPEDPLQELMAQLRRISPLSDEARRLAGQILKAADTLDPMTRLEWHTGTRELMGWSKSEFKDIVAGLRKTWYQDKENRPGFYNDVVFVKEINSFYNWMTGSVVDVQTFVNSYADRDEDPRKAALKDGLVKKVDRLDYAPGLPRIFEENNVVVANLYTPHLCVGRQGDVTPWLNHWDHLGWGQYRDHMLKYMAYTLRHPEVKINHMMVLGGREGSGKDFLMKPLIMAMGPNATVIEGDELLTPNNSYLMRAKFLHVNEVEVGGYHNAQQVTARLKPLAAAPPDTIRITDKWMKAFSMRNIVNGSMATNSRLPLRLQGTRRFFAVWSDLDIRGDDGNRLPEWSNYWRGQWEWMKNGGWEMCVWHLLNCVDVSDFNPGEPPPMTDYLREIEEDSRPPLERTILDFARDRAGLFESDILTVKDVVATLKAGSLIAGDLMSVDPKHVTARNVTMALRSLGYPRVECNSQGYHLRMWVVRHKTKHLAAPKVELARSYRAEMARLKGHQKLHAV